MQKLYVCVPLHLRLCAWNLHKLCLISSIFITRCNDSKLASCKFEWFFPSFLPRFVCVHWWEFDVIVFVCNVPECSCTGFETEQSKWKCERMSRVMQFSMWIVVNRVIETHLVRCSNANVLLFAQYPMCCTERMPLCQPMSLCYNVKCHLSRCNSQLSWFDENMCTSGNHVPYHSNWH